MIKMIGVTIDTYVSYRLQVWLVEQSVSPQYFSWPLFLHILSAQGTERVSVGVNSPLSVCQ